MWTLLLIPLVAAYPCADLRAVVDGCADEYNATTDAFARGYRVVLDPWWSSSVTRFMNVGRNEGCDSGDSGVVVPYTWNALLESRARKMRRVLANTSPNADVGADMESFWRGCRQSLVRVLNSRD